MCCAKKRTNARRYGSKKCSLGNPKVPTKKVQKQRTSLFEAVMKGSSQTTGATSVAHVQMEFPLISKGK